MGMDFSVFRAFEFRRVIQEFVFGEFAFDVMGENDK